MPRCGCSHMFARKIHLEQGQLGSQMPEIDLTVGVALQSCGVEGQLSFDTVDIKSERVKVENLVKQPCSMSKARTGDAVYVGLAWTSKRHSVSSNCRNL